MDHQRESEPARPGASTTTFSWVESTDPASFVPPNHNEATTYSVADDVSVSGRSESVFSSSNTLRVYVRVSGARIVVPISHMATVDQLHAEAVRRAARVGSTVSVQNSILQTTGHSAALLFGEDLLTDILDTTENLTFLLKPFYVTLTQAATSAQIPRKEADHTASADTLINPSSTNLPIRISGLPASSGFYGKGSSKVYIRWITQKAALDTGYLRNIPVDSYSSDGTTSVTELRAWAFSRVYGKHSSNTDTRPDGIEVELFLGHCYLSSGSNLTVADLTPEGISRQEPLNIFVSAVRRPANAAKLWENWGFECTDRSIATFMSSLEVMIHEITKRNVKLDRLVEVLWNITHFPPALLAFKQLYESILPSSGKFEPSEIRALGILAESFREIAQKMVPPWISNSPGSLLESSRQLFAWIHTLATQGSFSEVGSLTLVHGVELQDITVRDNANEIHGRFKNQELVNIDLGSGLPKKKILVSLMSLSHIAPKTLALALNGAEEYPCNYYFHLPHNSQGLLEHKRASCLHPADFDNLLEITNQVSGFKMIGPLQLANCTSSDLPIVTLDSQGFVSTYNQKIELCADGSYYTWNAFRGREEMSETNPGQYLLQKLNLIMIQRKKDKNWEVDAWTEAHATNDMGNPDEAIVICVDASGSMGAEMGAGWMENQATATTTSTQAQNQMSRMTEVKDVFRNLVSRISAYNLPTHLGLVTFSSPSQVRVAQPLTPVLLNFQHQLDGTVPGGPTAMFDALRKAEQMLLALKVKHPNMKCRIIVLTDGQDNSSSVSPSTICTELYFADIVLDAIVIGTNDTLDLFKIAKHTGGYAFCPKTRSALFQIFLLETFIDIKTRPDIVKVPLINYYSSTPKPADMQTPFDFPPCRPHSNQHDHFISLRDADRFLTSMSRAPSAPSRYAASEATARTGSTWTTVSTAMTGTTLSASGASRLILNEVKTMIDNQHEYIDVYVSESNMGFWKVVMQGPPASPYEDGTFLLYIEFGDQFPRKAPTARFITPILHPNITKHGRICHPIFDREWTPVTRVYQVIQQLWGILMSLEARDAVDPLFTLKFWTDPESGRREVKQYVDRFAKPSRATHRTNILNGVSSSSLSIASSSPPSYPTAASPPAIPGLATHLSTLRRPIASPITRSGSVIYTPSATASNASSGQSTPRVQSRSSSVVGSSAGLLPGGDNDGGSVASSTESNRRRRFFRRFQGH